MKGKVDSDDTLRHLLEAGHVDGVHRRQVRGTTTCSRRCRPRSTRASRWSPTRSSSCAADGREVFFDAEHFFDGYRRNPEFSLRVLEGAAQAGATRLVLCDTNGGTLPARGRADRRARSSTTSAATSASRVHLHDDAGTGVANALAGVRGGAIQVQGTINGYGERTGNCNLTTIIPNLTLKMGIETIPADRLERLTPVAHHVAELVNMALNPQARLRGRVGVRAQGRAARERDRQAARRLRARRRPTPSATAPASSCRSSRARARSLLKAKELGLDARRPAGERARRHAQADGARGLPLRGRRRVARAAHAPGRRAGSSTWFEVESFRVITDDDDPATTPGGVTTEATIKVHVGGERVDRDRRGQRSGERARHRAAPRARATGTRRSSRCTSPTTRCGCSTPPRAPARSPGCCSTPPTATAPGRRSA